MVLASLFLFCAAQGQKPMTWTEQVFTGGIKIAAPKRLVSNPQKVNDPSMSKVEFWQGTLDSSVCLLQISTLKDPVKTQTSSLFSGSAAGFAEGKGVVITGMKDLLVQGWPGLAVTVRQPDGLVGVSRTFRVNNLMIQVCGFYTAAAERPAEVDQFLDSLHFPTDGDQKEVGPVLTRFPLGTSGLTALFPREPEKRESQVGKGAAQGPMYVFSSDYGMRSFQVAYRDVPFPKPPTDEELDAARVAVVEDIIGSFHGKKVKQRDETVGTDQGLAVDFSIANEATGSILVYMHEKRMVTIVVMGPRVYGDAKTVDAFLHSVEWKP